MNYLMAFILIIGVTGLLILVMQLVWESNIRKEVIKPKTGDAFLGVWVSKRDGKKVEVKSVVGIGQLYVTDETGGGRINVDVLLTHYKKL